MAKLDKYGAPGRFSYYNDYKSDLSWEEQWKQEEEDLNKYVEVSDNLPEGEILGAVVYFPVADGHAIYRVTKKSPLTLQLIPFGDAWQAHDALIRGLNKKDILDQLAWRRGLNKAFEKQKANSK